MYAIYVDGMPWEAADGRTQWSYADAVKVARHVRDDIAFEGTEITIVPVPGDAR